MRADLLLRSLLPGALIGAAMLWTPAPARAEGSAQTGLNQPLYEYADVAGPIERTLFVDLFGANEWINVSACGQSNGTNIRFEIRNLTGTLLAATNRGNSNVPCNSAMNAPLTNPWRFSPGAPGTYEVRLINRQGSLFNRWDVSVTPDNATLPDPTIAAGRVWANRLVFNVGNYTLSTDADYYAVVPGGRPGENFVWLLDLNNFAGFVYELMSNDIGVDPPRSGISTPTAGNSVTPRYPLYLGYPEWVRRNPGPLNPAPPTMQNLRFEDDDGVDKSISPGSTLGVQDTGFFVFETDVSGTYAITIDLNQDGTYGAGDRLLLGNVTPGENRVQWDGRDAGGNLVPLGTYDARVQVRVGEFHFVANDVETSGGNEPGLTIFRALPTGGGFDTTVFWDDATLLGGTTTLPDGQPSSSPLGRHSWGDFSCCSLGNNAFLDTYTYGAITEESTDLVISDNDDPLIGVDVAGNVFSDLQPNGLLDPGEISTGLALFVKIFNEPDDDCSTVNGSFVDSAPVDVATGDFVLNGVVRATYCMVLYDNDVTSDRTPDLPAGWVWVAPLDGVRTTLVAGVDVFYENFALFEGGRVDGVVFRDDGAGGGTPNDGAQQGGETGLAGVPVEATSASCGGVCASASTDAAGAFRLWVPAAADGQPVSVTETNLTGWVSTGGDPGSTGGSYDRASDAVAFGFAAGSVYTALVFGDVPPNTFAPTGMQSALPGVSVFYTHQYTAASEGSVSFTTSHASSPGSPAWTGALYADADCDGSIGSGEAVVSGAQPMVVGDTLCLIMRVDVPPGAPDGTLDVLTITATFDYANAVPVLLSPLTQTDTTTVGDPSGAGLTLTKSADKATALPGEQIVYTVTYRNLSTEPLLNIFIYDSTPAYTTFDSAACGPLPANVTACTVIQQPAPGTSGDIIWDLDGSLAPGASSTITFTVTID